METLKMAKQMQLSSSVGFAQIKKTDTLLL